MSNECYTTDTIRQLSRGISNLLSEETETSDKLLSQQISNTKSKTPGHHDVVEDSDVSHILSKD